MFIKSNCLGKQKKKKHPYLMHQFTLNTDLIHLIQEASFLLEEPFHSPTSSLLNDRDI